MKLTPECTSKQSSIFDHRFFLLALLITTSGCWARAVAGKGLRHKGKCLQSLSYPSQTCHVYCVRPVTDEDRLGS